MSHSILEPSTLPYGAVPFESLNVQEFVPALDEAIQIARQNIALIKAEKEIPTFGNTIVPLENASDLVDHVATIYSNLRIAHGEKELLELAQEIMPRLIALESDINLDEELFKRVERALENMREKELSDGYRWSEEQMTLAEQMYKSMVRNGALLSPPQKKRLREIDDELALMGPRFSENVLKATNTFELHLINEAEVVGLPPTILAVARQSAQQRGYDAGWVFTLHAPSALPFLRYADRRDLREKLWKALNSRGLSAPHDNRDLVRSIASLRFERAKLLGFPTFADYQLAERMAEKPGKVVDFLDHLLRKSFPVAQKEIADLKSYAISKGFDGEFMSWDYAYWAHKLKEEKYQFDIEATRPYFELSRVLDGACAHARRLFDLEFVKLNDVPVYAPDVQVYRVQTGSDHAFVGLLYTDFYTRPTKNPGAWCTRFRSQWIQDTGEDVRPHVSIVCNFSPPTPEIPCLLNFQEVSTVFHEFGHALHGLLSRCQFKSLSCTNVFRDFVELPSQLMENWLKQPESLDLFAKHHETGKPLPIGLMRSLIEAENFHAGYLMVRQLRFGMLDFAWYHADPSQVNDVAAYEKQALSQTELLPHVPGTSLSCSFEHIFSGGYAAGYYGYKWAEVLDADAFEFFLEAGIFSREVARRFQQCILEKGGTEHPAILYQSFRGRDPDPDALLRRSHLISRG
jgi:peptidyl-dipeptidase Dcp